MKLSICMPYWNRQPELDRSLAAYARLYNYLDLEIVIADDGSPVPVIAPGCKVVTLPPKVMGLNPCVPLNAAVRASTAEVIVITNPEIEHREDVLAGMLLLLERPDDYVTVSCRDVNGMWLAGPQVDYKKNGRMPVPHGSHFHFCAMLTRALFDRVGGFDEGYRHGKSCDDNDWLWTLHAAGARFRLAPGCVMHYGTPHPHEGTYTTNRERLMGKWGHLWT